MWPHFITSCLLANVTRGLKLLCMAGFYNFWCFYFESESIFNFACHQKINNCKVERVIQMK